jgi:alpha-amylase
MVASRKDATALYFARPGEVGSIGTWDFMSTEVSAINNFHNEFIGANEAIYASGNFAVIERYNNDACGLVIVNCNGNAGSVSFNTKNIKNGEYIDRITGNKFTISNGKITGNIGSTGIAVIYNSSNNIPQANLSQAGGYFDSNLTINIDLSFATSARIKYGSEEKIITDDSSITIGSNMKNGESIEVMVTVVNEEYRQTKTYTFIKLSGITNKSVVVSDVPERYASGSTYDVYAWVWKTGQTGRLVKTNLNGTYIVFDVNDGENNFLLLTVGKGTQGVNGQNVWNFAVKQTNDFIINENAIYTAPESVWKSSQ